MKIQNIATCLRPYGLNGKQVHRIYFYDVNGVILASRSGWLEKSYRELQENIFYFGTTDVQEIDIVEPVKKIKKDFSIKKNFYVKAEKQYDWEDVAGKYDLYIYIDNSNVRIEKTKELTRDEENTTYINTVKYTEYLIIGITPEPFKVIDSEILKTEDTQEKALAKEILKILEEEKVYCNLDEYTLCNLLKVFSITRK